MRLRALLGTLLLLSSAAARADAPKPRADEPARLLQVETIVVTGVNERVTGFNQGRPFAISINKQLPDAQGARTQLVRRMPSQLDAFVFEWFGSKPPTRLNIMIGSSVPVGVAQAALETYATRSRLPVYLRISSEVAHGNTNRVYIGSLSGCGENAVTGEELKILLKSGLTADQFAGLVKKISQR